MTTSAKHKLTYKHSWYSTETQGNATNSDQNVISAENSTESSALESTHYQQAILTPSTPNLDVDLTSLSDRHGNSISFSTITTISVFNLSSDSGHDLVVGAASSNAWAYPFDGSATAKETVEPGGVFSRHSPVDGITVDSSNKVLRIAHDSGANDITVDVVISGLV